MGFSTKIGPHRFRPLRIWDIRPNGRCLYCYAPMNAHPMHCWVLVRPYGDKRPAELTFEMLDGSSEE